ncbi:MAG: hypothetical protein MJB57_08530 [Gemmatimonadetes bacterium]|nr:hypothetical protein [Gemmatimonadota bacterium]
MARRANYGFEKRQRELKKKKKKEAKAEKKRLMKEAARAEAGIVEEPGIEGPDETESAREADPPDDTA